MFVLTNTYLPYAIRSSLRPISVKKSRGIIIYTPFKLFSAFQSYCPHLSIGLLSYDSRSSLNTSGSQKKTWSRLQQTIAMHFPIGRHSQQYLSIQIWIRIASIIYLGSKYIAIHTMQWTWYNSLSGGIWIIDSVGRYVYLHTLDNFILLCACTRPIFFRNPVVLLSFISRFAVVQ